MPNPVVHFEIISKDPDALSEFYKNMFDWNVESMPGDAMKYIMAKPDGKQPPEMGINGGFGDIQPGSSARVTFYIAVDDVGASLDKIEKAGGTKVMGPERVPNGPELGIFIDPQGNTIGLVKNEPM